MWHAGDPTVIEDPKLDVPAENIPEIKKRIQELEAKVDEFYQFQ